MHQTVSDRLTTDHTYGETSKGQIMERVSNKRNAVTQKMAQQM